MFILIVFLIVITDCYVQIDQIIANDYQKYVKIHSISWENRDGLAYVNASGDFLHPFEKMQNVVMVAVKKDSTDKEYTNILLKTSVNVCNLSKGVIGNFVTKVLMENFKKSANFEMKCPFETGNHSIVNLEVSDKLIPIFKEFEFLYQSQSFGKLYRKKGLVNIYTYKVYGLFKKN
ncbi:unnamed protein product [Diamesa hyperborea]